MKNFLLFIFSGLIFINGTIPSTQDGRYRIEGTIDSSFNGQRAMLSFHDDEYISNIISSETSIIDQGRFSFEGDAYMDGLSSIVIQDRYGLDIGPECKLLLEPGTISVSYLGDHPYVKGTPLNDIYMQYLDSLNYFLSERKKIEPEWRSEIYIAANSDLSRLYYSQGEYTLNFIERNFSNPLGKILFMSGLRIEALDRTIYIGENIRPDLNDGEKRYDEIFHFLDTQTKAHPRYIQYEETIKKMMVGSPLVGKQIENFTLSATDGSTKQLSDYIGKKDYLLLECWASWCSPCLAAIPGLKEIYSEHSDRLEIVSISLDTDETSWANAMKTQDMPWPQFADLKGLDSDIAKALDIKSIPFSLLLNKQGVVVMLPGVLSLKRFMQENE